jgi:hypothetical protein
MRLFFRQKAVTKRIGESTEFDSIERKKFASGCGLASQGHMPAYGLQLN